MSYKNKNTSLTAGTVNEAFSQGRAVILNTCTCLLYHFAHKIQEEIYTKYQFERANYD